MGRGRSGELEQLPRDCEGNLKKFRLELKKQIQRRHAKQIANFEKLKSDSPTSIFDPFDHCLEQLHSDYLAWLLDSEGSHGLAGKFGRVFLSRITKTSGSWKVISVAREVRLKNAGRVDLLLHCQVGKKRTIVIIENKIFASLGKSQLERYQNAAAKQFKGRKVHLLLLAPRSSDCECSSPWKKITYLDIAAVLLLDSITNKPSNGLLAPYALGLLEKLEGTPILDSGLVAGSKNMVDFFEPEIL